MKRSVILFLRGISLGLMFPALFIMACSSKKSTQDPALLPSREVSYKEESENTGSSGIPIRIYHSNNSGEALCVSMARTEEVTPEILLLNLSLYNMVPDTVSVEKFQQKEQEDGVELTLDLSGDYEVYLSGLDEFGESIAMGSLVNTFLDAYQGKSILITTEGETLNTGHDIYNGALKLYPYEEASYEIEEKELAKNNIRISYPQITGLSNEEIQEKWNGIISGHARQAFEEAEEGSALTVSYTVKTMNDQLLSILIEGYYNPKDAAYPTCFRYTYNIDPLSGESVRLAYRRDIDELAKDLLSGKGYQVEGELGEELKERLTILYGDEEQLADALRDFDYGDNRETPAGFSYQEDGKTHLCIEVPHALGDYADVILE